MNFLFVLRTYNFDLQAVHKMFKVLCNVKFCTFFIFLYVYDLFHILLSCDKIMDTWNVCVRACITILRLYIQFFSRITGGGQEDKSVGRGSAVIIEIRCGLDVPEI
jgi:hypothetical protein